MSKVPQELDTRPPEVLFVSASTSDPYPAILIDPRTGVSTWSYKGSHLQGAISGLGMLIGSSSSHLLMTVKERGLLHAIGTPNHDRFYARAILPGPIESMAATKDGSILFAAIRNQIFAWSLLTGELLCAFEAHYQTITRIAISVDDSMLVTAGQDGVLQVWAVVDLLDAQRDASPAPLRKWTAHYLAVSDLSLSLSPDANLRIASVGADRTAAIHSVALNACLVKITTDRPLTASVLDQAECRLFLGTDVGNIAQIDLYKMNSAEELTIQTTDDKESTVPIFNGHDEAIARLCLNGDGCQLASGDKSGKYCIWDIRSRQCLRVSTMAGTITALRYVINSPTFWAKNFQANGPRPNLNLDRTLTNNSTITLNHEGNIEDKQEYFEGVMDQILERYRAGIPSFSGTNGEIAKRSTLISKSEGNKNTKNARPQPEVDYEPEQRMSRKAKKRRQQKLNRLATLRQAGQLKELDGERIQDRDVEVLSDEQNQQGKEEETASLSAAAGDVREIARLQAEIVRLNSINAELYQFTLEHLTQKRRQEQDDVED